MMHKFIIITFVALEILYQNFMKANDTISLPYPNLNRNTPIMKAYSLRASAKNFDTTDLGLQDLSDLLWAANGINRKESGKRTAPSALNAQDIDIYVFMKNGIYIYNAPNHSLIKVIDNDYRNIFSRNINEPIPPVILLLVSDISKFSFGDDSLKLMWGAMDAGIVSQNISLFCAAFGLATRPRAGMNQQKIKEILKLNKNQFIMLNHPVSYMKINS